MSQRGHGYCLAQVGWGVDKAGRWLAGEKGRLGLQWSRLGLVAEQ
jgi:hypothetical protein